MPTLRSQYSIEQFEKAFQKFAHEQPRFTRISTDDYTISFSYDEDGEPRRVSVQIHKKTGRKTDWGEREWLSFAIVPKNYIDSNHISKIELACRENEAKVSVFLQKIMAPVKPIPRFELKSRVA